MNLTQITTKLETAQREDIAPILDKKAMEQGATQAVDYVGFALENIENSIERIDSAIKELQAIKKEAQAQMELIKIGVSDWLTSNGVEKLQGDRISSISVFYKKETSELVIDNEEAVINSGFFKMTIDKTASKQALLNGIDVEGAHIEITHNEPSIRLNKKRVKDENINTIQ
jgi:Siphovirus Gp157